MADRVFHTAERSSTEIRSLVIGADITAYPSGAVIGAMRLPLAPGARVRLVHVLDPHAERAIRDDAAERLRTYGSGMIAERADLRVEIVVARGVVGVELARCASTGGAELVVVGGARSRGVLFPSTVAEVAARESVPVLVVGRSQPPYRRPLAALETADPVTAPTLTLARGLVGPGATSLDLVHPLPSRVERRMQRGGAPRSAIATARRWFRSTRAQELRAWLRDVALGPLRPRIWVVSGEAVDAVSEVVRDREPDLLVLAAEGGWLRRRPFTPSIAGRLIRRMTCDVLLARAPTAAQGTAVTRREAA